MQRNYSIEKTQRRFRGNELFARKMPLKTIKNSIQTLANLQDLMTRIQHLQLSPASNTSTSKSGLDLEQY